MIPSLLDAAIQMLGFRFGSSEPEKLASLVQVIPLISDCV